MIKKEFKKYKLNQIQTIKQNYKYIYIFRYYDLNINEIILLKKNLKKLKLQSLVLKQNLIKNNFLNLDGQNAVLMVYGNQYTNLIENLSQFKKIELIYLLTKSNLFSYLKLKQIYSKTEIPLNISLIKPFFNFLYYLRKI